MNTTCFCRLGLTFAIAWTFVACTEAQLPIRLFGSKEKEKAPAPKVNVDARRLAEINVEIAWLADPITFPYYLEAHVTGAQFEVRGYVPNKTVREHALRIAQVYSSLQVTDSMKEHPSLLVRPGAMSSQQLQASVQTSLRLALPKQHQQLKVECGPDGKVFIAGPVTSHEEKVAVSHALRRLHGCTSVQNLTLAPGEVAQVKVQPPVIVQNQKARPQTDEPPLPDRKGGGPVLIPSVGPPKTPADVVKVELPAIPEKTPPVLDARDLEKRVKAAYPQVMSVEVDLLTKTDVRINVTVRADKDVTPAAERILSMPELQHYREPALLFRIAAQ